MRGVYGSFIALLLLGCADARSAGPAGPTPKVSAAKASTPAQTQAATIPVAAKQTRTDILPDQNVFGAKLPTCSTAPKTGFFRDGACRTGPQDRGSHTVCATMTDDFLQFSRSKGNDLMTPRPEYSFPGLKAGDNWCLCVNRWKEALDAGHAPTVALDKTHKSALKVVTMKQLQDNARP